MCKLLTARIGRLDALATCHAHAPISSGRTLEDLNRPTLIDLAVARGEVSGVAPSGEID